MTLLKLATKLVGFNTVSLESSTCEIADFITTYLEELGFRIETYPYTYEGKEKVNLIARIGDDNSRIALSGHLDTVPFEGAWKKKTDPLKLTKLGENYYGRGIADMKLFLAIMLKVAEKASKHLERLPLALCFTSDEEIGCIGAKKIQGIRLADQIIIGEPTNLQPIYAHKGYMYLVVELRGKRGHSSDPKNGINVIPALLQVLQELNEVEKIFQSIKNSAFSPPYPTINIGFITTDEIKRDGTAVLSMKNIIPGYCRIVMEIRPIPGQDTDEILEAIRRKLGQKIGGVKVTTKLVRFPTPPMRTPENSSLVQTAMDLSSQKAGAVCFNTEGGIFNEAGAKTLIWGPGSIKQAHQGDEHVHESFLEENVVEMFWQAVLRLSKEAES